jgi:hypothetical protein
MSDLSERLRRLGVIKATSLPAIKPCANRPLVEILGAREITTLFGEVLLFEDLYHYGYSHGNVIISLEDIFPEFHKLVKINTGDSEIKKHLFIDTETTGLSGGTGTIPFLIGFGYFDQSGFRLGQLILENPINENAQLVEFAKVLQQFENTITFNGKSFDLPLIHTRYALNNIPDPLDRFSHIDLLHLSRKIWKSRLSDRSLNELENHILHYSRSSEEVPGWMIPQIYFDFLKSGDGSQLKNVSYHNAIDVVSMAALYIKINMMLKDSLAEKIIDFSDLFAIGQMYENINESEKALTIYKACFSSKELVGFELLNLCKHMAVLYRKQDKWNDAAMYWKISAELNDMESCIALAKFNEHILRNRGESLDWVARAESILHTSSIPLFKKKRLISELEVRKQRLGRSVKNVQEEKS